MMQFSIWKEAILCKVKGIKGLCGDVLKYVAQASPKIDAEITQKGTFRMKTNSFNHLIGRAMRKYMRHPSDVPIEYHLGNKWKQKKENLKNISTGGLSFRSKEHIGSNTEISIQIPCIKPALKVKGIVVRCHKRKGYHDVAIKFLDKDSESIIRNIEQLCYIEKYKKDALKTEGRELSGEEAASEWIAKYAKDFPV